MRQRWALLVLLLAPLLPAEAPPPRAVERVACSVALRIPAMPVAMAPRTAITVSVATVPSPIGTVPDPCIIHQGPIRGPPPG